jgi:WD40 repeat protein
LLAELPSPTPLTAEFVSPSAAVDATGSRAAIPTGKIVTIYDLASHRVVGTVLHDAPVSTVVFAPNSRALITGSIDGMLQVTDDGAHTVVVGRLSSAVDASGFLPDGRVVAVDAERQQLAVYDVARHARVGQIELPSRIAAIRVSLDGRRLIAIPLVGRVNPVVLCDLDQYRIIAKLDDHKAVVFSAKFVDSDRQILTAGTDGTAQLWDAATGRLRKTFLRSSPYLFDAALDPTGEMVVTAGGDGVLRFWEVSTTRMIWSLRTHESRVAGIHFEGTDIVTRGFTGEIARWTLPSSSSSALIDHITGCLPLRFDEETGGLVEQARRCDR